MNNNTQCAQAPLMNKITGDQEIWLRDRLVRLVNLVEDIQRHKVIDAEARELAIQGAINGQALAILEVLGLEPEYTNLPKRSWWYSDSKRESSARAIDLALK